MADQVNRDTEGTTDPFKIQGSIGGNITKTKHGTEHYRRIANIRWAKEKGKKQDK